MRAHVVTIVLSFATTATLIIVLACGGTQKNAAQGAEGTSSAGSQCGKDADCKGDRVCDHGQCISPR